MDFNIQVKNPHFNLKQIALSGQCFRFRETWPDVYAIVSGKRLVYARQEAPDKVTLSCSKEEFDSYWREYFDLPAGNESDDYALLENIISKSKDVYLKEAFAFGSGIRILKQDIWEALVCFIISQNNNIKRITASVDRICEKAGFAIPVGEGEVPIYRIPRCDEISGDFFIDKSLGLGYRDVFLKGVYEYTAENPTWLDELKTMNYEEAMKRLLLINGVGPKVANCVCLFGLHHTDAFPIDTHIKQILNKYYPSGFDFKAYEGFGGIVQQYMFYHKIKG